MLPWALAALGALAAAAASGGKRRDDDESSDESTPAQVGYLPAVAPSGPRSDIWPLGSTDPTELELALLGAGPVDLSDLEADEPTVGMFYAGKRGDMLLGEGPKSISWLALYKAAEEAASMVPGLTNEEVHAFARSIAGNAHRRVIYANLVTAGSVYNDVFFGTWGHGPRDFVGPHGRALCLGSVHADIRQALLDGVRPVRTLAVCTPADRGTNAAMTQTRAEHPEAQCRPYPWLPMLNLELLYRNREVTTRGCLWPGTTHPCSEPPIEVWRLIGGHP